MSLVHEPIEKEVPPEIEAVLIEVNHAANRLHAASTELAEVTKRFEGAVDEDGQIKYGIKVEYETALESAMLGIVEHYEAMGKRPPAEDIRQARARRTVRVKDEALYVAYVQAEMKMGALQRFIASQKQVISGKQSVLNGLKALGA